MLDSPIISIKNHTNWLMPISELVNYIRQQHFIEPSLSISRKYIYCSIIFSTCNNDTSLALVCILYLPVSSNIILQSPPSIKLLLSSTSEVNNVSFHSLKYFSL